MNGEEILKNVVAKLHMEELEALPSDEYLRENLEVSLEFRRKMMKLISHSRRMGILKKSVKRAAAFFLAALATLLLLCAVNENIRAFCVQFFKENILGGMTEYRSPVESSEVSAPVSEEGEVVGFRLGYVPEGFEYDEEESYYNQASQSGRIVYYDCNELNSVC